MPDSHLGLGDLEEEGSVVLCDAPEPPPPGCLPHPQSRATDRHIRVDTSLSAAGT